MKNPDLNLLYALDILLKEGSVAGAARRLNLSSPATSRILARIRDALDDPIFVRSQRGLVPTPKALAMQAQVRGAVELARGVFQQSQGLDLATLVRTFSLRANDVFIGAYGSRLRELLRQHCPRCVLRFVPESDLDHDPLNQGSIDLSISSRRAFGPDIKVQHLFETAFVGLARRGHPILEKPVDLEAFVAHEHVTVSRRGLARGPLDEALMQHGLTRRVAYITPTFHSAMFAVAESDLLLPIMPVNMLPTLERLGLALQAFELPVAVPSVEIVQAWHPRLDNDPAHRWLRRTLKHLADPAA
ncbi:LysR family transcriptional regulator [Pseudomonas sp. TE3610]